MEPYGNFETPVFVALGRTGAVVYSIGRLGRAAEALLHEWPEKRGPKYIAAKEACLLAWRREGSVEDARRAFEDAAREAGILLIPGPEGL